MLQRKSVSPFLRKILTGLMEFKPANDFRLVGGTALALQIGHRRSLDIDMFSDNYKKEYDFDGIFRDFKKKFAGFAGFNLNYITNLGVTIQCNSKDKKESFKIDFWKWPNPFLHPALVDEKIRMAHLDDLVAMKLEAINDRSNYRDYVDIAFLSEKYTFSEMMKLYSRRTLNTDCTRIIKALSNPDDLVKDQKLHFLNKTSDSQIKDKVDFLLFVYTKEQETKHKKKFH